MGSLVTSAKATTSLIQGEAHSQILRNGETKRRLVKKESFLQKIQSYQDN